MPHIDLDGNVSTRPATPTRYVYFVQAEEVRLIKIGVADRLEKRLRDLALQSPDRLCLLGIQICHEGGALEASLHERFAEDRQHGEWFLPTEPLLDHIEAHARVSAKAVENLNAIISFPTMKRGRPSKEMMRQMEVAGATKWR